MWTGSGLSVRTSFAESVKGRCRERKNPLPSQAVSLKGSSSHIMEMRVEAVKWPVCGPQVPPAQRVGENPGLDSGPRSSYSTTLPSQHPWFSFLSFFPFFFCFLFFVLFCFSAAPVTYGSSWARGRIRAAAAGLYHSNTGSLTHRSRLGIEPASPQILHRVLNPLSHNGNSSSSVFVFVFLLFRATGAAYGGSQARGLNWSCRHRNEGSKPHL